MYYDTSVINLQHFSKYYLRLYWHLEILVVKGDIPLHVFPAICRKYCNFKTIFYQINYTFSGNPPIVTL